MVVCVFVVWIVANAICVYYFQQQGYVFLFLSTVVLVWVLLSELIRFWNIGLVGVDIKIRDGINYNKALGMVSSSLDFLGIGAAKLTGEAKPFEEAVNRCDRSGHPIRFLLSRPESADLEEIARKANVDRDAYKRQVRESLRKIAAFKNSRAKNIEVRFYEEIPAFRLMFIDDEICLASHYILGKGDGSQLPQLQVIRKGSSQDINSLYYGFHEYFENIWAKSKPWNFRQYLEQTE